MPRTLTERAVTTVRLTPPNTRARATPPAPLCRPRRAPAPCARAAPASPGGAATRERGHPAPVRRRRRQAAPSVGIAFDVVFDEVDAAQFEPVAHLARELAPRR